ncbi:MAG: hypothetical protein AAGI12_07195 [Pseudomonadota bacterium]
MKRMLDLALLVAVLVGAIWTYQIKHEAEMLSKKRTSLQAQIAAQKRKILLLEADWAIETAPGRLEILANRYSDQLGLAPLESTQISTVEELPAMRQERDDSLDTANATSSGSSLGGSRTSGIDSILTGGISGLIEREQSQ